jgi:hypothetical protein
MAVLRNEDGALGPLVGSHCERASRGIRRCRGWPHVVVLLERGTEQHLQLFVVKDLRPLPIRDRGLPARSPGTAELAGCDNRRTLVVLLQGESGTGKELVAQLAEIVQLNTRLSTTVWMTLTIGTDLAGDI